MGRSFAFPHGLDSLLGSMGFPRRGARLWMGGGMPDTRSIPMAETREPPCQAHARPESARQACKNEHSTPSQAEQSSRAGTPRQAEQSQHAKPGRRVKHGRTGRSTPSQTELPSRAVAARKATQAPPGQAGSPIHAPRPTLSASSASQRHLEHERKCASSRQSHPRSRRRKSR